MPAGLGSRPTFSCSHPGNSESNPFPMARCFASAFYGLLLRVEQIEPNCGFEGIAVFREGYLLRQDSVPIWHPAPALGDFVKDSNWLGLKHRILRLILPHPDSSPHAIR